MELLETMRAEDGRVELLELHLERLSGAARAFGFPFDASRVRTALDAALDPSSGVMRVRLTLDGDGCVCVGLVGLEHVPPITSAVPVTFEPSVEKRLVTFKTTDRLHYDAALARAWSAGVDEAILVDADGLVIEATRANVWVRRGGQLLTPDLHERGLAGVMRTHLLATRGDASVAALTEEDLRTADEVLLSNAVRGLFPVRLGTRIMGNA